ncbi:aspartate--tRNA ligase [Sphaerisporangium melleum]|uniref:Aspartate--tRNA(Asp/Asn) ligase n=1 Tax=Sphaerisporangium melleum TaxID=321316 RepID=A0A917R316_9ACTN|nr:aspartate--tRNA ligase [Sphaerisporangium melleum]GGK87101.1 aspartate--tRNA ligase [Sphaerisporangium melleum]GII72358.1 aspartate--tRNA ligase [Sphaerisporangium melleum]
MIRTHTAGSLRKEHAGQQVTLAGWVARRRDHGGVVFIDLRDASGSAQVVFREEDHAHDLRSEYCVRIAGEVRVRPEGNENPDLPTGEIEVVASEVEVLSESAPLPFPIEGGTGVSEEARLKYRYLDMRRQQVAHAMRVRSTATYLAHEVMREHGFLYVETPDLTRSTPEGARDFLVPVRLQPGNWYALPQSPQLFKQLLMVGGLERYYQLARCFRDEDLRADRQPEFTQIDVEMSFVDQDDVIALGEALVGRIWKETVGYELPTPLPRMTYADAMSRYGSDKPDLRFGCELVDMTSYFADTTFRVFQAPYVGAVVMPGGASQTRKELDAWQDWAKARGARGLAYVLVQPGGELGGPVAKNLSETERAGLAAAVGASEGDAVFFAAGIPGPSRDLLGAARLEIGRRCGLIDESLWSFLWVVDAPMFEPVLDDVGRQTGWTAVHHPFTGPKPEYADTFHERPGEALAYAYDMVCNGMEIGGGSIRIHRAEMQQRVFEVLGISKEEAESKFGFLLEAFKYGPPPHGGIAYGWDRICMLLAGGDSIRDVIAFPKTASGFDPLTGAPTPITADQRKEAGVDARKAPAAAPKAAASDG